MFFTVCACPQYGVLQWEIARTLLLNLTVPSEFLGHFLRSVSNAIYTSVPLSQ